MMGATLRRILNASLRGRWRRARGHGPHAAVATAAAVCISLVGVARSGAVFSTRAARPEAEAAQVKEVPIADATDVNNLDLESTPFDRILLLDGTVHECEPLRPRPLPEMQPSETLEFQPLDAAGETAKVLWRRVERVVYFEDLLIAKANLLIARRQFDEAFEYLQKVQRRTGDWAGLEQALERLVFEEAASLLEAGRVLHAVNLLAELRTRNPDYPDLGALFDRGAEELLSTAFRAKDYRHVRWLLVRLGSGFPNRAPVQHWREQMTDLARRRMDDALAKEAEGNLPDATAFIQEAARIWPELAQLNEALERIVSRHTAVRVAVQQLPEEFGIRLTTSAQRRTARLVYQSLVVPSAPSEREPHQAELAERYETSNLGRRMTFALPAGRTWSDGTTPITAMDAAYALSRRNDPADPAYDANWVRLGPVVRIEGPWRFTIDFSVPPLRPEAWFQYPVFPQRAMTGRRRPINQSTLPKTTESLPASGPFVVSARTASRIDLRANRHYGRTEAPLIHQIVEEQFPNSEQALRALVRGQVALVEHVVPADVEKVRGLPHVTVGRYAVPRVHLIAMDFRTVALRLRALRRALVYAIDREAVLYKHLLAEGAEAEAGAVLPAILRRGSSDAHPTLEPRPYEPRLAAALVAHAKLQLGGAVPPLKLHYPPDDVARVACRHIQAYLEAAGLKVQLVERTERALEQTFSTGSSLDLVYRIVTTTEPAVELPDLLVPVAARGDAESRLSSPWLRQLLIRLQQAPNLPVARATMMEIDQVVHEEVAVVPLWEIADYFAHDRRLSGIATPLELYETVERWRWEPTVLPDSFALKP